MIVSSAQCRAARALLGWSQDQLAETSKVAKATIAAFEQGKRTPYDRTLEDIREALEEAGVVFLDEGEVSAAGGRGVRLKLPLKAFMEETDEEATHVPPPFRHDYNPTPEPSIQPKGSVEHED